MGPMLCWKGAYIGEWGMGKASRYGADKWLSSPSTYQVQSPV